jgi:aldehyde dehydrogenase (NAD+)
VTTPSAQHTRDRSAPWRDRQWKLYIDGSWVHGHGDERSAVINPANEDVIAHVPQGSSIDVDAAVAAARRAFDEGPWPQMTPTQRGEVMLRMADIMERRVAELIELNICEAGAVRALAATRQTREPIREFRDLVERIVSRFQWERPLDAVIGSGIGQGMLRRVPWGVTALISAYNFPLFLNLAKVGPALAAGCTAVLKPAPDTPLQALVLAEVAEEAGLPPGVLSVVTGDVGVGQRLTTSPLVDLVSFTGSDVVGSRVYQQAAATNKKVVLELGGKSANIICDDANLDRALPGIIAGIVSHAGQGCALLTRTLVHQSRHDELVEKLVTALQRVTVGDPADPLTQMGPVISDQQRGRVENLIQTGVAEGANLAVGGDRPRALQRGFFLEPTLFVDVDNSMTIAQQEIFGPVGAVITFDTDAQAVRIANDSRYGLSGSVWAKDPVRAYAIAKQLRTGNVTVNGGGGGANPDTAFGGFKQSGLGREWGAHGLDEYLQTQCVMWGVAPG